MTVSLSVVAADHLKAFGNRVAQQYASYRLPPVTIVELFLTEDCTLRCDYCFVKGKTPSKRMPWDVAKKAVDFLVESCPPDSDPEITLFGGEPLLEFGLIKRIVPYARERAAERGARLTFSLTTNGTVMSDEIAAFGRQHGFNIMLSIDGTRDAHDRHRVYRGSRKGSWDTVVGENFRLLKSIQGWIGARITVCPDTVGQLSSGVGELFDMGVNQFLIGPDMDTEWAQGERETLSREMHKVVDFYLDAKGKGLPIRIAEFEKSLADLRATYSHMWGCDAGRTRAAVSTEGDLYPCSKFVCPLPGLEAYRLGHVDVGLTNLEARMDFIDNGADRRPKCANCDTRDTCVGGCPAINLHMKGCLFTPSDFECFNKRLHLELLARIPKEVLVPDAPEQNS